MTRRSVIATVISIVGIKLPSMGLSEAPLQTSDKRRGFELRDDNYFSVGAALVLMTPPESAIKQQLTGLVGSSVVITVHPTEAK